MKKGFTLSEVLITLVVIGIIAAVTIPIIQQKYEKRKLYSQFMKVYSTLNQAMNMSIAAGNFPSGFNFVSLQGSKANAQMFLDTYIKPYVNVISVEPCFGSKEENPEYKDLTGNLIGTSCEFQSMANMSDSIILSDGSAVSIVGQGFDKFVQILVDVNASKGPNTLGRDVQVFRYWGGIEKPIITGCAHEGDAELSESYYASNCNPKISGSNGTIAGDTCADRLLREGKMNY